MPKTFVLPVARTNAQVRTLKDEVRIRMRRDGRVLSEDIEGQPLSRRVTTRHLPSQPLLDRIPGPRDRLAVIDRATATITCIDNQAEQNPFFEVDFAGRRASLRGTKLADKLSAAGARL
ncbi:hypothetical protein [Bradyrhizobium sp. ORS 285]|uniref:hypothetical protein n=1 Tax=Bradyrhizobium sp. ORS 285 TaxID=115808 RepID=UPI0005598003|nr:hypothetical protein [Bradyrhizobium sp. ORS 285]